MTNDKSRRAKRKPAKKPAEGRELPPDEAVAEAAGEPEPEPGLDAETELELQPEKGEPEPTPTPGPAPTPSRSAAPPKGKDVGYRGSLPPRDDRLARSWIVAVIGIFVLILVLAAAGLPSRLIPEPTPAPVPSFSLEPIPSSSVLASPE